MGTKCAMCCESAPSDKWWVLLSFKPKKMPRYPYFDSIHGPYPTRKEARVAAKKIRENSSESSIKLSYSVGRNLVISCVF